MFLKLAVGVAVASACLAAVVAAQSGAPAKDPVRVKSDGIHAKVLTLDTHVDMRSGDYGVLTPGQKVDLVKMQQGGMKGVFLAVFVAQRQAFDPAAYKAAYDSAMRQFDMLDTLTQKTRPEMCAFAVSRKVGGSPRPASVIMTGVKGLPGGREPRREGLLRPRRPVSRGHRQARSATRRAIVTRPQQRPLDVGRQVVAEMNRLGIVDVSHSATTTLGRGQDRRRRLSRRIRAARPSTTSTGTSMTSSCRPWRRAAASCRSWRSRHEGRLARRASRAELHEEISMQPGSRGRTGSPPAAPDRQQAEAQKRFRAASMQEGRRNSARRAEGLADHLATL
jgi:hypothetical protein